MCYGGSNSATRAARRAEDQRQAQVTAGTGAVDRAFAGRQPQYDDFLRAMQNFYRRDLGQQHDNATRQTRFSLARGGLTGGSAQTDMAGILGRDYQRGTLQGEQRAQMSLADLMARDESSRMGLLSLVQGGADMTTAAQQSANAMRANLSGARASGMSEGLGNVFGGTADLYRRQQEAAQRRRGLSEAELYANPFSRAAGGNS